MKWCNPTYTTEAGAENPAPCCSYACVFKTNMREKGPFYLKCQTRKMFGAIQCAAYFICFDVTITKTIEFVLAEKFQSSFTTCISLFLT